MDTFIISSHVKNENTSGLCNNCDNKIIIITVNIYCPNNGDKLIIWDNTYFLPCSLEFLA